MERLNNLLPHRCYLRKKYSRLVPLIHIIQKMSIHGVLGVHPPPPHALLSAKSVNMPFLDRLRRTHAR